MSTVELNNLELQIETLIQKLQRLKMENQTLKNKLANSAREKVRVMETNTKAANRLRQILSQLKDEL